MTNEEAIAYFKEDNEILVSVAKDENVYDYEKKEIEAVCMREAFEANEKAIQALEQQRWIPIKWHEITDEERVIEEYPNEWLVHLDCQMPDDGERILVQTKWGCIGIDECYIDDAFSLDSGYDWVDDIIAWMPLPQPYTESKCEDYIPHQHIQHIEAPFDIMRGTFDAEKGILTIEPPYKTEEQQRKKGKWIRITNGAMREKYICSECGRQIEEDGIEGLIAIKYPYCHCGAKMEVDK